MLNGSSVSLANYMLVRKESDNPVLQKYKSDVETNYGARVDDVNFESDGAIIQSDVNNWVKTNTKGLITQIIDSPPNPQTFALLLNAIHFKGEWIRSSAVIRQSK